MNYFEVWPMQGNAPIRVAAKDSIQTKEGGLILSAGGWGMIYVAQFAPGTWRYAVKITEAQEVLDITPRNQEATR